MSVIYIICLVYRVNVCPNHLFLNPQKYSAAVNMRT
jgi:hypothetical protein